MKVYDWIVIIGFIILFGWCIIVNNKYSTLQEDYNILKNDKEYIIDSINRENIKIKEIVKSLEDTLSKVNSELEKNFDKIEIVKKEEFTISNSFSESTILLKENLLCTDL